MMDIPCYRRSVHPQVATRENFSSQSLYIHHARPTTSACRHTWTRSEMREYACEFQLRIRSELRFSSPPEAQVGVPKQRLMEYEDVVHESTEKQRAGPVLLCTHARKFV
jgi:hypothetical protein